TRIRSSIDFNWSSEPTKWSMRSAAAPPNPPFAPRTQKRPRMDQPAPAAARRRPVDRRTTPPAVRETYLSGPQRQHRRRLDRQRAPTRYVGLHRPWWTGLRDPRRAVPVLHLLRRLLGARDRQARPHHLNVAGADDPGHPDRAIQRQIGRA